MASLRRAASVAQVHSLPVGGQLVELQQRGTVSAPNPASPAVTGAHEAVLHKRVENIFKTGGDVITGIKTVVDGAGDVKGPTSALDATSFNIDKAAAGERLDANPTVPSTSSLTDAVKPSIRAMTGEENIGSHSKSSNKFKQLWSKMSGKIKSYFKGKNEKKPKTPKKVPQRPEPRRRVTGSGSQMSPALVFAATNIPVIVVK